VSLDRFNPSQLPSPLDSRRKLGLPLTGPLIGVVGRLQRWKGMHFLVEAMPAILRDHPDAHAVIVGGEHAFEPEYPGFLRDRIASLQLDGRVRLAGLQSNVPQWMQAMDVIVHASDNEPFGIVVIEAMALGKPVVAADTAGPKEIITPGLDGLLWQPGQVPSLVSAITRLLDEPAAASAMGAAAVRRSAQFGAQSFAANVVRRLA
jgi:glycosyltransferase involved in cell wall biosynthesis